MRMWSMLLGTVIGAVLSGCMGTGFGSPPTETPSNGALAPPLVPAWAQPIGTKRLHLGEKIVRDAKGGGIYASDFIGGFVAGYSGSDKRNKPPACTITVEQPGVIDVDPADNLIVPGSLGTGYYQPSIIVYQGPGLCGPLIGSVPDTTGNQPRAVASLNARTGKIVVAESNPSTNAGDLVVCTLAAGCGEPMRRPKIKGGTLGVAVAKNGDCWMSAEELQGSYNPPGAAALAYFRHCQGRGKTATGYKNPYYGGLFIDTQGNLGAVDLYDGTLYVYKGCNPVCMLIGGPFALQGLSVGAGLNRAGNKLAVADFGNQAVDIYAYTPTSLTYLYSINNGLLFSASAVFGAAFSSSNKQ